VISRASKPNKAIDANRHTDLKNEEASITMADLAAAAVAALLDDESSCNVLEELCVLRDYLVSSSSSNGSSQPQPPSVREVLAFLLVVPSASSHHHHHHHSSPTNQITQLADLLSGLMEHRVDTEALLPLTQDDAANEDAMREGQSALTLTRTALVAAEIYALVLKLPGALGAGWIAMEAVSALSNLLRRWKIECCGRESELTAAAAQKKKRQGKARLQRGEEDDSEEDSDDDDDGDASMEELGCGSDSLSPQQLLTSGLAVARAVSQIPLQKEFLSWKTEAVEVLLCSVVGVLATAQAVSAGRGDYPAAAVVVEQASSALCRCILLEESIDVGLDYNDVDSDEIPGEAIRQRQDTVIAILRGLYSTILMKEVLPKGESGKIAAANAASQVLVGLISEIKDDIVLHPQRWPKSMTMTVKNRRASVASTVPTTVAPSTMAPSTPGSVEMMECEPSTPKTANKRRLRASIGKSSAKRASMTPKPKTPLTADPARASSVSVEARPGPVFSCIVGMLQKLATAEGLEKAAVRGKTVETVHQCLCNLPFAEQSYLLQFLIRLCHSKVSVHRLVASELVGKVLSEDWLWNDHIYANSLSSPFPARTPASNRSKSLSPLVTESSSNMPLALFGALQGRLVDRSPTIRATSTTALASVCSRLSETKSISADESRSVMGIVAALGEEASALLECLRHRVVSDEKATVRRAACGALVELLMICESTEEVDSSISEYDIQILSQVCQDSSMMTRRAAADGLTRLLEFLLESGDAYGILPAVERAWTASTLTMVLDPETGCVTKAVELVERLVLFPVLNDEASKVGKRTAWRILASLGDGEAPGAARGETEALRACLEKSITAANSNSYTNNLFRTIHAVAVETLENSSSMSDAFVVDVEDQRTGVWTLFEASMGHTKDQAAITRVVKRSKIDLDFLGSSWDKLLQLFFDPATQPNSKMALQRSMRKCLKVLSQLASAVDVAIAEKMATSLQELIGAFSLPPEVIGSAITALTATTIACGQQGESEQTQHQRCVVWIRSLFRDCESEIASYEGSSVHDAGTLARAFFTVGELSLVGFSASDDDGVQQRKGNSGSSALARGFHERPSKLLVDYIRAFMTPFLPGSDNIPTPDSVRAHAFIALGKLCLRDAQLAKRSLNILARELHENVLPGEGANNDSNKNWMIQSNCLLILGDLCVKYTNMVDRFLPVMAGCLQAGVTDSSTDFLGQSPAKGSALVRKHAILLLSSLLLQDYIKWRGLLFHRFLVASVDEDDDVAHLAEMVLYGPLASKQSKLFANQFVESLFVLNRCTAHPIYQAAAVMGDGGSGISVGFDGINLTGEAGRVRRMHMYQAMLSKMSDEEKIGVTARIGKEILGGALKTGNELNLVCTTAPSLGDTSAEYESAFIVLSDALAILSSPWIRVGKNSGNNTEDIEDPNVTSSKANRAQVAKGRLLSNLSRKHLIEILLPILCNLKAVLQKSCSPLLKDLMACIVDVYQRYKTEAEECLANDPTTLQEIQYDAQQYRKAQRQKTPGKNKTILVEGVSLVA